MGSVRLQPLIEEAAGRLRARLPGGVLVTTDLHEDAPAVGADPEQLRRLLLHLATAATRVLPPGGSVDLRVAPERETAAVGSRYPDLAGRPVAVLTVTSGDRGGEPPASDRALASMPAARARGEAGGWDLTVLPGLVAALGGHLEAAAEPGLGSVLRVLLPGIDAAAQDAGARRGERPAAAGEHVLLVDDEPYIITILRLELERCGFRVSAEGEPRAALARFAASPEAFDVVVTDQRMPGMSGLDFIRAIRAVRDDVPIIVTTGGGLEPLTDQQTAAHGIREVLLKPVPFAELERAIHEAVAGGRPARRHD